MTRAEDRDHRLIDFRGQPAVELRAPDGAAAVVLLHGAQVVSWRPASGQERLFLSGRSHYGEGAAVRGGIPVVFPQFSSRGPLPRHGWARTRSWRLARVDTGAADALAVFELSDDDVSRSQWPFAFALELTVCVQGQRLDVELAVANRGITSFDFTAALHTYLRLADIGAVRIDGLQGCRYEDALTGALQDDADDELRIDGETDRIYFGVKRPLELIAGPVRIGIEADGFPDVVAWNPWREKSARLADLATDDFRRFVCIEAALIGRPKRLQPSEEWTGRQSLIAR